MKKSFILLGFITSFLIVNLSLPKDCFSQQHNEDSLWKIVHSPQEDTGKVIALNTLAGSFFRTGEYDSVSLLAADARDLAIKIKYKRGELTAHNQLGNAALGKGIYTVALKEYFEVLRIGEQTGNKKGVGIAYGSIGTIYMSEEDYTKGLEYCLKALKIAEEINYKTGIMTNLSNIGSCYYYKDNFPKALEYFFRVLKMEEEAGKMHLVALQLLNIGDVYLELKDYSKAMEYYQKSLKLAEELGDKNVIANDFGNMGTLYFKTKDFKRAEEYLKKAIVLSESMEDLDAVKEWEGIISEVYEATGNHRLAFFHYKKFIAARDSIANEENIKKQTQTEMQYVFDKEQATDSIKNLERAKQENIKHEQEIQQQKIYTYGGVIGFLLMIVVAGVSYRAFRQKQKANKIISLQKDLVEMKQKEILDSIHYAKRIQHSLLPTERYIESTLSRLKAR